MKTFSRKPASLTAVLYILVMASIALGGHASAAGSAELSTDSLNLEIDEAGSVTFSGDDGGKRRKFEWTFPEGLDVGIGASSNLKRFKVKRRSRRLKLKTSGNGSFSAEFVLSSGSAGTYVLSNIKAGFSFSPTDVTVTVDADGPPPEPPDPGPEATFTLRVCEGANWKIRANMVLSDMYLFGDGSCGSSTTLPGPEIRVEEGDSVSIKFINDASNDHYHALIFPALDVAGAGVAVGPGDEMIYTLPTDSPGTFYYAAAELDVISPALENRREIDRGMYGGIVVQSANERHVRPEHDAIRFFDEIPRVVAGGDISFEENTIVTVPGEAGHESPTYLTHEFLVNGITIDSKVEGNNLETVTMHGEVGEDTMMRMICVGSETHAMHLHGHLVDATGNGLTTNGVGSVADTVPTDVVRCPSGDVRNLYVAVRAPGTWVWHCHRETHLLNNVDADYPGGMFTHMEVGGGGDDDD